MAFMFAKIRRIAQVLVCVLAVTLNSCVYLVVGGIGAIGGYAVSPDTIEGMLTDHSPAEVWGAAKEVVGIMGLIEEQNEAAGMMLAKVQGARVTITMNRVGESTVKLTIKARKAFFPKIKISEDIFMRVHKYLTD